MFNFLLEHWFVALLILAIYFRLTWRTVHRYHNEILRGHYPNRRVLWTIHVMEFALAPILWVNLKRHDESERERVRKEADAREHNEAALKRQEIDKKDKLRQQWLRENPPTLYCNTIDGITAVVRPEDYEKCKIRTTRATRNGLWGVESILMPMSETYLFVNENGRRQIEKVLKTLSPMNHVCGWFTDLDDMVQEYNVILETKNEIFVPFVNETILPFDNHLNAGHRDRLRWELIESQSPK